jgi:DNA-binding NarL/FixJ family response regulator
MILATMLSCRSDFMRDEQSGGRASRILIVDDHPSVREALAIRISLLPDLEVCGEAMDITEALRQVEEQKPDLAIIDVVLKHGDGIDLVKRIKARDANVRMLVWSMHSELLYAERALRAGAYGYLTKDEPTSQVVSAIRNVLAGRVQLSARISEKMLQRAVGQGSDRLWYPAVNALSDRELEVLRMIGQGMKTSEIADNLHLSVKTVGTYRDRIRQKLALADGRDLARYAAHWVLESE